MIERLQKIISASGLMSRRAAEKCISEGRVTVNGRTAMIGSGADPRTDDIRLDGRPLPSQGEKTYIMLNKPKGYVTTMHDERGRKCVTELVRDVGERLYPVGRLDMYSEGLLIMTNDGDFANRLMHPSHEVCKTYETHVAGCDIGYAVEILRGPMEIDGYVISPAEVNILSISGHEAILEISVHEGRNRQVRKMCEIAGLKVTRLRRVSEGSVCLGDLRPGCWRHLTADELRAFDA